LTPELWQKVSRNLDALLPLTAHERAERLDHLRHAEPTVAEEVESLLRQQDATQNADLERAVSAAWQVIRAEETAPAPAQIGPYVLQTRLGKGGMGEVWRARDPQFRRSLAIKVLALEHRGNADLKRRFLEEAQLMGQLQHPGIPPVHNLGELPDGRPYFTMKLIRGKTLAAQLLERSGPVQDRPRLLVIFEQICQTLASAHAQRVIHRDLKPANVMVGAFGEVQVMDWGLAKVVGTAEPASDNEALSLIRTVRSEDAGAATAAGSALGTPAYMAPEQARGETATLDQRCDVFGLGAILCNILTGKPPFVAPSARDSHVAAMKGDLFDALARLDACGADAELLTLAKRCLAAEPKDRFADAAEVASAMAAYQDTMRERLRQAEVATARAEVRVGEERKRRRLTWVVAAGGLAAVLVIAACVRWVEQAREAASVQTTVQVDRELSRAESLRDRARGIALGTTDQRKESRALWEAALAVVGKAEDVLATGPADARWRESVEPRITKLRAEAADVAKDRDMAESLDAARECRADLTDDDPERSRMPAIIVFGHGGSIAYASAFRSYGIDILALPPDDAARKMRERERIAQQLIDAVDDWLALEVEVAAPVAQRLLAVACAADPDPFRVRLRTALTAVERNALLELARSARSQSLRMPTMLMLADGLQLTGEVPEAVTILRHARQQAPDDFWINDILGVYLVGADPFAYGEAGRCFSAALAVRPKSHLVWDNLGTVLTYEWRFAEAIQAFASASKHQPDFLKARTDCAEAYFMRGDAGDVDRAMELVKEVLQRKPTSGPAQSILIRCLLAKGAVDEARTRLRAFQQQASDNKMSGMNLFYLGLSLNHMGLHDDALAVFQRAVEKHLDVAQGQAGICWSLALKRPPDYEKAAQALAIAKKRAPTSPVVLASEVFLCKSRGQLEQAIAAQRLLVAVQPGCWMHHVGLGDLLLDASAPEQAMAVFQEALRLKPDLATGHFGMGRALTAIRRFDRAIASLTRAVELGHRDAVVHGDLGYCYNELGEHDRAVLHLTKACQLDERGYIYFGNRAYAHMRKGRYDQAIADYRKSLQIKPSNAISQQSLGNVYLLLGDPAQAIRCLKMAVQLNPKSPAAHSVLATALEESGDLEQARRELQQALALETSSNYVHRKQDLDRCEALLKAEPALPDMVAGKTTPRDGMEALRFGKLARLRGQYAAATRLYEQALAQNSKMAAKLGHNDWLAFARTAARAGAGKGHEPPPESERAKYRVKTLTWLRRYLELHERDLDTDSPRSRYGVQQGVRLLLQHNDLALVRPGAVEQLPAAERSEWQSFWDDVTRLVQRADTSKDA
jgi:serine/threonine-protein kinase